jgi:hypothetical protein
MAELTKETIMYYQKRFLEELESYAATRKKCVTDGKETPQLASLLVEKFGYGIACAAHVMEIGTQEFYDRVDQLVEEIDPRARKTRQQRWASKPAGLELNLE